MSTKLKQFLVDTYGFRDKRIKDIEKKSSFTIDKCPTNSAGDYNAAACRMFLRVEGENQLSLQLSRNAPLNDSIQIMVHISSEAIRTRNRSIAVGDSMRQFLLSLGLQSTGGERGGYTMFKRQMESLAACRLTLGMQAEGRVVTVDAKPIKRFEAWLQHDGTQRTLWPGVLELSQDFYDTLREHAVPLDYRALSALKKSALALDVYTWLAHRLRRVHQAGGVMLSWENLREQFGQEYATAKNFKHEFRDVLRQVCVVYPDARVEEIDGGLKLYPSRPPLSSNKVAFSLPRQSVDKSGG